MWRPISSLCRPEPGLCRWWRWLAAALGHIDISSAPWHLSERGGARVARWCPRRAVAGAQSPSVQAIFSGRSFSIDGFLDALSFAVSHHH